MPVQIVKLLGSPVQVTIDGTVTPQGAYDNATDYAVGDLVSYNGSSYIMYSDATAGTLPTDTTKWAVIASKGDTGATGAAGANGTDGEDGTDGINGTDGEDGLDITWRGAYNGATAYVINDAVSYQGSSYICKLASTGNLPTNTTYFDPMALKGDTGATGADGADGLITSVVAGANVSVDNTDPANPVVSSSATGELVDDATPTLGGELDADGNNIIDLADVTFKTGATGGTLRTGTSNADKFELQAYDVNGGFYQKVLEADAGNTPTLEVFADSFAIWDNADETKKMNFTLSGEATGTQTTLALSATVNRTITLPDATGTVALISDTAYGAGWNGDTTTAPSKNAIYDKIETLGAGGTTAREWDILANSASTVRVPGVISTVAFANLTGASNTGYFRPYVPTRDMTITEVKLGVVTGVGSSYAQIGIYADDNNSTTLNLPGTLLYSTNTFGTTSNADVGQSGLSWSLTAGTVYWLRICVSHGITMRGMPQTALPVIGMDTSWVNFSGYTYNTDLTASWTAMSSDLTAVTSMNVRTANMPCFYWKE